MNPFRQMLIISSCITLAAAGPCPAELKEISFGGISPDTPNWAHAEQTREADGSITFSKFQDGITFQLNIRGVADAAGTPADRGIKIFPNGAGLGVIGNNTDTRISNGEAGRLDDEYIILTLKTQGEAPASIALKNILLRYTEPGQGTDFIHFIDHKGNTAVLPNIQNINYTQLSRLTPLSAANAGTWSLAIGSVNWFEQKEASNGIFALGKVSFHYTAEQKKAASAGLIIY